MTGMSGSDISVTSWGWIDDEKLMDEEGRDERWRVWRCRLHDGPPVHLVLPHPKYNVEDAFLLYYSMAKAPVHGFWLGWDADDQDLERTAQRNRVRRRWLHLGRRR